MFILCLKTKHKFKNLELSSQKLEIIWIWYDYRRNKVNLEFNFFNILTTEL